MRVLSFSSDSSSPTRLGVLSGHEVRALPFDNALDFLAAGPEAWEAARRLAEGPPADGSGPEGGRARWPLAQVALKPPLERPPSLRDFYAFEDHVANARAARGKAVHESWYRFPVFYFSNPTAIYGHEQPIPHPRASRALDYELEVAAVIGRPGRDLDPESALDHVFGFTIFNDWSARDLQYEEVVVGLGPAKGKDFASSLGPCIVTPDELADRQTGRPGVYDLRMSARVNGEERSRGNWREIHFSFGEILARASADVTLHPGEVIGSGTVGTGCLLELTEGNGPWLQPGDVVELEIERLGVLRNKIASP